MIRYVTELVKSVGRVVTPRDRRAAAAHRQRFLARAARAWRSARATSCAGGEKLSTIALDLRAAPQSGCGRQRGCICRTSRSAGRRTSDLELTEPATTIVIHAKVLEFEGSHRCLGRRPSLRWGAGLRATAAVGAGLVQFAGSPVSLGRGTGHSRAVLSSAWTLVMLDLNGRLPTTPIG